MLKRLALAAIAGTSLLTAAPSFADSGHWKHGHGWRAKQHHKHFHHYHRPQVRYVAPAPIYYAPPPPAYSYYVPRRPAVVYEPVYLQPRPVVVYRQPGVSVSLGF